MLDRESASDASRVLPPMPVIVGAPRSGTTLLRFMLDAHPDVAIPPETGFLPAVASLPSDAAGAQASADSIIDFPAGAPAWADYGIDAATFRAERDVQHARAPVDVVRAFYRSYAARFGKPRWGDKTPTYCLHLATVGALLPEAHFVHIIRDGRDVAQSIKPLWFSPGESVESRAAFWRECVRAARDQSAAIPARYLEIRYEELVTFPERTLVSVCDFLGLEYDAVMLEYHRSAGTRLREHGDRRREDGSLVVSGETRLRQQALTMQPPQTARVGAWHHTMAPDERERFEAIAGDVLRQLGYA